MDYNDLNRPRGVLSPDDRKFLTGEKEYKHRQSKANRKGKIKERLLNAILDFELIFDHMDTTTIEDTLAFETEEERKPLHKGFLGAIGTIYLASFRFHPPFKGLLEGGVFKAEQKLAEPYSREVSVDFSVESEQRYFTEKDLEYMIERIEVEGIHSLSEKEQLRFLKYLVRNNSFDPKLARAAFDNDNEPYSETLEKGRKVSKETKDGMYDRMRKQKDDNQDS